MGPKKKKNLTEAVHLGVTDPKARCVLIKSLAFTLTTNFKLHLPSAHLGKFQQILIFSNENV